MKKPALTVGEGVVDRPWERMAWSGLMTPTTTQAAVAATTMEAMSGVGGEVPTYARVDLIGGPDGTTVVLEVEVVDPYLSLDMEVGAAARLAAALLGR